MQASGSPPSAFQVPYDSFREECGSSATSSFHDADHSVGTVESSEEISSKELDYEFICFFLSGPRLNLYRSIDFRCEDMISGGCSLKVKVNKYKRIPSVKLLIVVISIGDFRLVISCMMF